MGGGTSKFDATDWAKADGGLLLPNHTDDGPQAPKSTTIDGAPPTQNYQRILLVKKGLNQREFDILDASTKTVLYTTKSVPGTLAWFDVLGPKSKSKSKSNSASGSYQDDWVLRVQVDLSRRTWMVYRYHTPVFAGQTPSTDKGVPMTMMSSPSSSSPSPSSSIKVYKSACITVSWSRYMAITARYGPPSIANLAKLDEGSSDQEEGSDANQNHNHNQNQNRITSSSRSSSGGRHKSERSAIGIVKDDPARGGGDGGGGAAATSSLDVSNTSLDSQDDLLQAAQQVAAHRREEQRRNSVALISVPSLIDKDSSEDDDDTDNDNDDNNSIAASNDDDERPSSPNLVAKQALTKAVSSCQCPPQNQSPESSLHNPSSFDHMVESSNNNHGGNSSSTTNNNNNNRKPEQRSSPSQDKVPPATATSSSSFNKGTGLTKFLSSGLLLFGNNDEGAATLDPTQATRSTKKNRLSRTERRQQIYDRAMEGQIDLDQGPLVECQEIYNKIVGNHQTSLIGKEQVLKLWQWDETQHTTTTTTTTSSQVSHQYKQEETDDAHNPFVQALEQQEDEKEVVRSLSGSSSHRNQHRQHRVTESSGSIRGRRSIVDVPNPPPQKISAASPSPSPSATPPNPMEASLVGIMAAKQSPRSAISGRSIVDTPTYTPPLPTPVSSAANPMEASLAGIVAKQQHLTSTNTEGVGLSSPAWWFGLRKSVSHPIPTIVVNGTSPARPTTLVVPPMNADSGIGTTGTEKGHDSPRKSNDTKQDQIVHDGIDCNSKKAEEQRANDNVERGGNEASSSTASTSLRSQKIESTTKAAAAGEPLIGYWSWKNTYTVHKMELHLAKNSDLALHIVLAIVCNQVRYERNALAMTV